jgi:hypothetical protein
VTLRLAATLALVLGASALLVFLRLLGEGPGVSLESSHLRDMKNRLDPPPSAQPITFADMVALPHRRPVGEYSAYERRGVSIEGYVQTVMHAVDGDLHLEVTEDPLAWNAFDTSYLSAEITPGVRGDSKSWTYDRLVEQFHPIVGGPTPWRPGTRRVRIRGWLMYDWQYDQPRHHDHHHRVGDRLTGWEIHPVTGIEVWDDDAARFVEVAR